MIFKIWRTLFRAAVAACLVIGSAAQAAVFYQSKFDPLGFAGSAVWKVDDNCNIKTLATGYYGVNLLAPGGCDVALWSLSVSLWTGGSATLPVADPTLITKEFGNEQANSNPSLVAGMYVINDGTGLHGALAGVDTFLIGPEWFDNGFLGTQQIKNNYGVQFTSGHSPLGYLAPSLGASVPAIGNLPIQGAYLWEQRSTPILSYFGLCPETLWATFACAKESLLTDQSGLLSPGYARFTNLNDDGTFAVVPEPGSLALLVGALGAGWLSRRRQVNR